MPRIDASNRVRRVGLAALALALGACAQSGGPKGEAAGTPAVAAQAEAQTEPAMAEEEEAAANTIDPMADMAGDKPLPPLQGLAERIDCTAGADDQHRIGLEARGGQVTYFTYYNKWRLRTCSLELARDAAGSKWRLTADGATRVQTPHGVVLIRTRGDAYNFEFQQVARRPYCATAGVISGTMIVNRGVGKRVCSTSGFANSSGQ